MQPNHAAGDHLFSQRQTGMSPAGDCPCAIPDRNGIANLRSEKNGRLTSE